MSCTLSHESRVMLADLLGASKNATRVCLRAEMDRLVDPMLDSIFNRLQSKLANGLERTQSAGGGCEAVNHDGQLEPSHQVDQPSCLMGQPSTSNFNLNPHQPHSIGYEPEFDHEILAQVKREIKEEEIEMAVKKVMDNVQSIEDCDEEDLSEPVGHIAHHVQFGQVETLSPSTSTDHHLTHNTNLTLNGQLEHDQVDQPSTSSHLNRQPNDPIHCDDSAQWIEDELDEEELPRPAKRPRTRANTTQPKRTNGQSQRQSTAEAQPNQVNNHDKHIITVRLHCPESECPDTFDENELNDHLMEKHLIGPLRCLVKNCAQSFHNRVVLGQHIKQVHQGITQWHCGKCTKHFTAYHKLSQHNHDYHQIGHFQCSIPSCTFTGEHKAKVFNHYTREHKPKPTLNCQHSGCHFRTSYSTNLKQHKRVHLGIKPYRCKWSKCDFAAAQKGQTIVHIRRNHLAPKPGSVPNGAQLDPSDYVEVVNDLL